MKIAVMGAGALGCYFGGRLAQGGHQVSLIARGPHLAALQTDGLRISSPLGDAHVRNLQATSDPAEVGPVDVVLFMVKNRDVESAAEAISPLLGPETMVITGQNGVSAHERLGAVIGDAHVVPGVVRIPASIPEPGRVLQNSTFDVLVFGELDGTESARCKAFFQALEDSPGVTPLLSTTIIRDLWSKFCSQSTVASLTTLTGLDIGPLRDTEASAKLFRDAIVEACQVAAAVVPGFPLTESDRYWGLILKLPPTMHASMLDDLRAGKPLEHEFLSGEVVRLGAKHGVATPIHSVLYAALKPIADQLDPAS